MTGELAGQAIMTLGASGYIDCLRFSPDPGVLALGTSLANTYQLRLIAVSSGTLVASRDDSVNTAWLAFAPNGSYLFQIYADCRPLTWLIDPPLVLQRQ